MSKRILFFIFSIFIPLVIAFTSAEFWSENALQSISNQINHFLINKINGVESFIPWKTIFFYIVLSIILYKYILVRYINNMKDEMSAKEKRTSLFLLSFKISKTTIIWIVISIIFASLNIAGSNSLANRYNVLLSSIFIGEIIRVAICLQERLKKD